MDKIIQSRPSELLRYVADIAAVVRASVFQDTIDLFIEQVRGQLRAEQIGDTNLDNIWCEVLAERADPEASERRRLEALMGFDPDEAIPQQIDTLVADAKLMGAEPMNEVAAAQEVLTAREFKELAETVGFIASSKDAVRLQAAQSLPALGDTPVWKRGADVALVLRTDEMLGAASISNRCLAELADVDEKVLTAEFKNTGLLKHQISFELFDENLNDGRIVLHSKRETGRRFELARILGDRIAGNSNGRLFLTRVHIHIGKSFNVRLRQNYVSI